MTIPINDERRNQVCVHVVQQLYTGFGKVSQEIEGILLRLIPNKNERDALLASLRRSEAPSQKSSESPKQFASTGAGSNNDEYRDGDFIDR